MLEREVFDDTANDTATLKFPCDVMGPWLWITAELSYCDATVIVVLNHTGSGSIQTNKTKAAQDVLRAKVFCQKFLTAESILQREQGCLLMQERREQRRQCVIRSRLQRNNDEIRRTDFFCRGVAIDFRNVNIFFFASNVESALAHGM